MHPNGQADEHPPFCSCALRRIPLEGYFSKHLPVKYNLGHCELPDRLETSRLLQHRGKYLVPP